MAKSSRASVKKENNRRKAASIFGPAELARDERLSAKLLELARQPKPETSTDVIMVTETKPDDAMEGDEENGDGKVDEAETAMDVDTKEPSRTRRDSRKRVEKKRHRKGSIVFTKYSELVAAKKKKSKCSR
ncbi:hypothetical protein XA68_15847 [Ophiocordyceps unilateralis]|uniref:DUF2423 domain-containing protein n=1 Tax=Ophiocordyceps unilateralis TaxID=268505 RepID=A0A2A9P5T2_OPHUN|nr:hypothetical protein XA68_15847 [Ophiocordyceps unilateralis]